jgi:hypothetical protein
MSKRVLLPPSFIPFYLSTRVVLYNSMPVRKKRGKNNSEKKDIGRGERES